MKNSIKHEKLSAFFVMVFFFVRNSIHDVECPDDVQKVTFFNLIIFCRVIRLTGTLCHLCQSANGALACNLDGKPSPAPYFSFLPLFFMCLSSNGKKAHSRLGLVASVDSYRFCAGILTVLKTKTCNIFPANSAKRKKWREPHFCILIQYKENIFVHYLTIKCQRQFAQLLLWAKFCSCCYNKGLYRDRPNLTNIIFIYSLLKGKTKPVSCSQSPTVFVQFRATLFLPEPLKMHYATTR